MRVLQGVGGALLMANSSAIITDAFPADQRGLALGLNMVAGIAGSFLGLVIGGVLAPIDWRLVFLVSVPFGLFGTVWAYLRLRDTGVRRPRAASTGGATSPSRSGLIAVLVGITYGIQPYGGHTMGWTNPWVLAALIGGVGRCSRSSASIETRVADPMFHLDLFRIRAFTAGNLASLLAGARPRRPDVHPDHLAAGHLAAAARLHLRVDAAVGRHLHAADDRRLPRRRAASRAGSPTGSAPARSPPAGMLIAARQLRAGSLLLPVDFTYWLFAAALLLNGFGMGLFASPNRAAIMNSPARRPARRRRRA